jgi:LmbE family N-acetylglucosaminyl deacetylase
MSDVETTPLRGRVVVISPHLDDAVFSLGASIWDATRAGAEVTVVTVLAGDPDSELPAGEWDRGGGFSTAGAAIRVRREEDHAACESLGATVCWLPFADAQYPRGADDATVVAEIAAPCAGADVVLLPGFPLDHPDHAFVARLVLGTPHAARRVGLYVEQPYAADRRAVDPAVPAEVRALTGDPAWVRLPAGRAAREAKRRAAHAYRSQVRLLGGRRTLWRVARHEASCGGETIGWLSDRPR